jgi:hypothetical protein
MELTGPAERGLIGLNSNEWFGMGLSEVEMENFGGDAGGCACGRECGIPEIGFHFPGRSARPGPELRRAAGREMGGCGGVLSEGSQIAAAEQVAMLDFSYGGSA